MRVRRQLVPSLLALVLGAACAGLVACGDDSKKIPGARADALLTRLEQVRSSMESGSCAQAAEQADRLLDEARELPGTIDRKLRQRIGDGAEKLVEEVPEDCEAPQTTETTDTTTLPETTTETTPTVTETAPTTPTGPTGPTETVPQETTPQETTPTDPGSGGTEAPGEEGGD